MLKLYATPKTRATRAVWALEEAGAQYEYITVNLMSGEARQQPYLAINPGGKVPTLVDGDLVLTESGAIVHYIGERFPQAKLIPEDPHQRAQYFRWCFFAIGELEQPLWTLAKHQFAIPEKHRVPAIAPTAQWEFKVAAKVLSSGLGDKPYIAGESFSGADILIGHTLSWAQVFGLPLGHENLEAYAKRVLQRPGLLKARILEKANKPS
ncbi:MAG: glutathione S-transferase family protein [Myxococcales bacterium]|nr:glutathione S-transferase family protein [Myxococcales bacterium]